MFQNGTDGTIKEKSMKRCYCCDADENTIEIIQYTVQGKGEDGKRKRRKVNVCICCDAWGMASDEKLKEFAGLN